MKTQVVWGASLLLLVAGGTLFLLSEDVLSMIRTRSTPSSVPPELATSGEKPASSRSSSEPVAREGLETATFGSGCFWCTEAVFQRVKGVESVVSGYSGGHVKNPTYLEVCSKTTGHAEVVQLTYDPQVVTYPELLEIFWKLHDPTTLNRQGNDEGPQYRSAIFYHTDGQRELAEHYKRELDESGAFSAPIVTEITPISEFYPAED